MKNAGGPDHFFTEGGYLLFYAPETYKYNWDRRHDNNYKPIYRLANIWQNAAHIGTVVNSKCFKISIKKASSLNSERKLFSS